MNQETLSELRTTEGITIKTQTNTIGNGSTAIDFAIDWQENNPPAEKHPLRYNAVENSAIILRSGDVVSEAQLRLPPIPTEDNPKGETESALKRKLNPISEYDFEIRLAKDGRTWTPHIQLKNVNSARTQDVINLIKDLWDRYREVAKPDGDI